MQQRLLTVVLLISGVLSDWPQTIEANLASAKSRAKRATAKFHQDDPGTNLLQLDDHGLVLVPATEEEVKKRCKRSEEGRFSKYKRLSHSVHVQSDIRYR